MIRVALVDDDESCRLQEKEFINAFSKETGEDFEITEFKSGMDFITDYKPLFDIVFFDIEMPLLSGMETARRLRQVDSKICIIFITRVAKYAIEGYEVNAIDYVVKPIQYPRFKDKLKKAVRHVKSQQEREVMVKSKGVLVRIPVSKIYFIEADKHYLVYNTADGEYRERGNIESALKELSESGFSLCNSGCIVNLKLIQQVTQNEVIINGVTLPLSRRRIKDFRTDMLKFFRE